MQWASTMKTSTHTEPTHPASQPPFTERRLLVGLPTPEQAEGLRSTLLCWGWAPYEVADCSSCDAVDELAGLLEPGADCRTLQDELRTLERFADLTHDGHSWLLVAITDAECARQAAKTASLWGASVAIPFELHGLGQSH